MNLRVVEKRPKFFVECHNNVAYYGEDGFL